MKWHLWPGLHKDTHNPHANASGVTVKNALVMWPMGHQGFLGSMKSFQCDPFRVLSPLTWLFRLPHHLLGLSTWPTTSRQVGELQCLWGQEKWEVRGELGERGERSLLSLSWLSSQMLTRAENVSVDLKVRPSTFFRDCYHLRFKGHVFSTKHTKPYLTFLMVLITIYSLLILLLYCLPFITR